MKVKVYSTPTCTWCKLLKEFLKRHNVKFEDVDVSKDKKSAEFIQKQTGSMGVPQTEISNGEKTYLVGFDDNTIKELKKLLKLK